MRRGGREGYEGSFFHCFVAGLYYLLPQALQSPALFSKLEGKRALYIQDLHKTLSHPSVDIELYFTFSDGDVSGPNNTHLNSSPTTQQFKLLPSSLCLWIVVMWSGNSRYGRALGW